MAKLTDKQKQFLKKHNLWNEAKDKSKLGILEEGNFKDFFRRKEKVEEELARLPNEQVKQGLMLRLQAAENKATNKQFKAAYKDLEQVKKDARLAANSYVESLSLENLVQEVNTWKQNGEIVRKLVTQVKEGMAAAKIELAKVGTPAPFASGAVATEFLRGLQQSEDTLRSQINEIKSARNKLDVYLALNNPGAQLQNFGLQLNLLQTEKNADVAELTNRVELAQALFIHGGKTLVGGEFLQDVNQLALDIDTTLAERKKAATFLANQVYWKEQSGPIGKLVLEKLATNPVERTQIEGLWAFANGRAEKGGEADLAAAVMTLADLKPILDNAQPEVIGTKGKVAETGAKLVEARKLQSAQVVLAANVKTAVAALERITLEFAPALPTALNVQALKLKALTTTDAGTNPEAVTVFAASVATETVALENLAEAPRAQRAAWRQELAAFELQLAALTNHPLNAEVTTVKPLLDKINEDLGKAKLDADANKWVEATAAVKLLVPRCAAAMVTADGLAHYNTIYQERKDRVDTLPAGVIAQEQPRLAVAAAKKLLTDAVLEKNGGKYPAAIALLNQIPEAVERAALLVRKAQDYDSVIATYEGYVTELGLYTGDALATIQTGLALFRQNMEAAKIAQTNDYVKSMTLLGQTDRQYTTLKTIAQQVKGYTDALQAFETRFTAIKDHKGRIAIEEFYARMQNDRTFAGARKTAGEPHAGTKILTATLPLHAAQIALAGIAENYKAKHKKAGEDIATLEKEANGGKAAAGLGEARTRITAAESAATAKDWPGALKAIEQAEVSIAAARKLLGDDKALGNLKDKGKLDAIATDFNAAFGVYQAMRNHVAGKDSGNVFAAKLTTADAPAQRARDASGLSPANFVLARTELDAAIAICEEALLLVSKKGPYDTALAGLKTAHTTTLPGLNTDDCITPKIEEVGQFVARAEQLAKGPAFNFDGAQREIAGGLLKVREAERDAQAYAAMKPDVQTITDNLTFLKDPARAAGVAEEIQRLEDAGTSINNDVTAGKILDAAKTAAATAKLCPGLKVVGEQYENAVKFRKQVVDAKPEIEGEAACAPELAEAERWLVEMQNLFDDHIYISVLATAQKVYQAIQAGKAILAASVLYEPARTLAETSLANALPNRNRATEERYVALRARYDAAVKLVADERNYKRATEMIATIQADCNNLAADAQGFRDYETALTNAKQKLAEAKKAKHASIQPLLAHLTARYDVADKMAKGGNFAGAKKLLEEIVAGAGEAVTAGEDAANYVAAAKELKKPETGINEAIAKAKQLYLGLMAKPEALYAVATLANINKKIEAAEKDALTDEVLARDSLVAIVDACAKARIAMGHYTQMEAEMKNLTQEITTLLSTHAQAAFVKERAEKLLEDIEAARREARGTGQHAKATKQIANVGSTFLTLRQAADAHVHYVTRLGEVEPELEKMEKHANRYAIVAEIASFRKDLASAAKAALHDNKAAMALLDKAAETAEDALLTAKMHSEAEPTVPEIKKILAGKDGARRLDAIVATLDAKAKRKVMDVAFAARFDCKLTRFVTQQKEKDLATWLKNHKTATPLQIKQAEDFYGDVDREKKAPDVRRFYDLMCALPDTHTKDNDSMQVFVQVTGAGGSDYSPSQKKVGMREGDMATSRAYGVALNYEIDEYDEGCELEEGEDISAFNWNTVHEVGHAVDDKLGFMAGRGNALAGWNVYGGNVRPIAVKIAEKFSFDVAYVASYMAKATAIAMPEPVGCDAEEWERRRVACVAWVDSARAGNRPWGSASTAKALAIGGVVYQESYDDGRWSSYNLAARKQGVTGYQFRAPGEWFSELYAAYHTKKLKPSHPAFSWLQSL